MLKFFSISAICLVLIALGWLVIRSLGADPRTSALDMHPDNFDKAPIEWVSDLKQDIDGDETMIDLVEYMEEQENHHSRKELD